MSADSTPNSFSRTSAVSRTLRHMNPAFSRRSASRSRRSLRLLLLTASLAALATPTWSSEAVRAEEPLRWGTISGGVGETPASPWVRGMEGCVSAAHCSTWLQSGCAPELGGVDPAFQAAIVDVGDLSDSSERSLTFGPEIVVFGARYTVQFWTQSRLLWTWDWCQEILEMRFVSWECFRHVDGVECPLRIPAHAKWMTITSSPENVSTSWRLS